MEKNLSLVAKIEEIAAGEEMHAGAAFSCMGHGTGKRRCADPGNEANKISRRNVGAVSVRLESRGFEGT